MLIYELKIKDPSMLRKKKNCVYVKINYVLHCTAQIPSKGRKEKMWDKKKYLKKV